MKTSNMKNIQRSISNIFSAAGSLASATTEVAADASGLLSSSIGSTPGVLKALLLTPFSATKGYLMEAEGLSEREANTRAFRYLDQNMALTIEQAGEGAGKLVATMFEDDDIVDDNADKKLEHTAA